MESNTAIPPVDEFDDCFTSSFPYCGLVVPIPTEPPFSIVKTALANVAAGLIENESPLELSTPIVHAEVPVSSNIPGSPDALLLSIAINVFPAVASYMSK